MQEVSRMLQNTHNIASVNYSFDINELQLITWDNA